MHVTRLVYLYTISWCWTLSFCFEPSNNQFLSSIDWQYSFKYFKLKDLRIVLEDNFMDDHHFCPFTCVHIRKLESTVLSVLPTENIADDPLNVFVDGKKLIYFLLQNIAPRENRNHNKII